MHTIKILTIGKTKEPWLAEALAEYEKRPTPHAKLTRLILYERIYRACEINRAARYHK